MFRFLCLYFACANWTDFQWFAHRTRPPRAVQRPQNYNLVSIFRFYISRPHPTYAARRWAHRTRRDRSIFMDLWRKRTPLFYKVFTDNSKNTLFFNLRGPLTILPQMVLGPQRSNQFLYNFLQFFYKFSTCLQAQFQYYGERGHGGGWVGWGELRAEGRAQINDKLLVLHFFRISMLRCAYVYSSNIHWKI